MTVSQSQPCDAEKEPLSPASEPSGQPASGDFLSMSAPQPWAAWDRGVGWEVHDANDEPINNGFRETFAQVDARLIAAAPDYAAAAEQMLAHEDGGGDGWWRGFEMLKAAHAKALGAAPASPADASLKTPDEPKGTPL